MNMTDELERLSKLHNDGALNDEEFAQAKAKLLNSSQENNPSPRDYQDSTIGEAANRYVSFRIIMGILGFVIFIIFFLGFFLPMFHRAGGFH
jgi:hypothetical protein